MSFLETVRRARSHLEEQDRVSLRALKREFELDDDAYDLFRSFFDWCRVHSSIGATPTMAMELADRPWSVAELMEAALELGDPPERPETSSHRGSQRPHLRLVKGGCV